MKTWYLFLTWMLGTFASTSCSNDSEGIEDVKINAQIEHSFRTMYPHAQTPEWSKSGEYYLVDFTLDGKPKEGWYDGQGIWYMTHTRLAYSELPPETRSAFENGDWSHWRITDSHQVERRNIQTAYTVEIESGGMETDLIYHPEGGLIKILENSAVYKPTVPSVGVLDRMRGYIVQTYPGSTALSMETDSQDIDIEIWNKTRGHELEFGLDGVWQKTSTPISAAEIPAAVLNGLSRTPFIFYRLKEVRYVVSPAKDYYWFVFELQGQLFKMKVDTDGKIFV